MFLLIAFLIFTGALGAAAYYVWSVPQKESEDILSARLRELRLSGGGFARSSSDLVRKEQRGPLAPLGDFVEWIGVLRRLQEFIDQANLKYRAPEVFAVCLVIAAAAYFLFGLVGLDLLILRIGLALALGAVPFLYILRIRHQRLRQF
jgi:Flp pilus assembly protein TadB